eukprot:CFRG2280T1
MFLHYGSTQVTLSDNTDNNSQTIISLANSIVDAHAHTPLHKLHTRSLHTSGSTRARYRGAVARGRGETQMPNVRESTVVDDEYSQVGFQDGEGEQVGPQMNMGRENEGWEGDPHMDMGRDNEGWGKQDYSQTGDFDDEEDNDDDLPKVYSRDRPIIYRSERYWEDEMPTEMLWHPSERLMKTVYNFYLDDPDKWTVKRLSNHFAISQDTVLGLIKLMEIREEDLRNGFDPDEVWAGDVTCEQFDLVGGKEKSPSGDVIHNELERDPALEEEDEPEYFPVYRKIKTPGETVLQDMFDLIGADENYIGDVGPPEPIIVWKTGMSMPHFTVVNDDELETFYDRVAKDAVADNPDLDFDDRHLKEQRKIKNPPQYVFNIRDGDDPNNPNIYNMNMRRESYESRMSNTEGEDNNDIQMPETTENTGEDAKVTSSVENANADANAEAAQAESASTDIEEAQPGGASADTEAAQAESASTDIEAEAAQADVTEDATPETPQTKEKTFYKSKDAFSWNYVFTDVKSKTTGENRKVSYKIRSKSGQMYKPNDEMIYRLDKKASHKTNRSKRIF